MSYRMVTKRVPMEGYCAECGSIKTTYGKPLYNRVHQQHVPCAPWWHHFIRRMNTWNVYALMNQRIEGFRW